MFTLRLIRTSLTLLLVTFTGAAQTQSPNAKPESSGPVTTGSITGRVVDESGQPLANAMVMIRAANAQRRDQTVGTDRDGMFRISGLDPVPYVISAAMPSYIPPPRDPNASPVTTYRIGDTVNLTLIKGGVVTGSVLNANGEPLVGVVVRAQMIRDTSGKLLRTGSRHERSTDDRGIYRIYSLPTGTYVVMAGGSPLNSYGNFNAFESDAPTYAPSATRDNAAEISIRAGEETSNVDIRYRGEPARVISGRVNTPNIEAGIQVYLTTADETGIPWSSALYQEAGTRTFMFTGVPDGDYYVYANTYVQNEGAAYSEAKPVKVRGADVTGLELTTRLLGSISGRVVLEQSKLPECADKDAPEMSEISVAAWHKDDELAKQLPQFYWSLGAPAYPDAEGKFKLQNLASGEYQFIPRYLPRHWYVQSMLFAPAAKTGKPIDATRSWTSVKTGDRLSGLTITIAQGAALLRGQVVVAEGERLSTKQWVYLVPAERERADEPWRFYGSRASTEGKIIFGHIAPGRYLVVTRSETEEGEAPFTKLRAPHENEARARIRREAEAAKIELEFKPCQSVNDYKLPLKPANSN